jgi:hypothetical protein
LTFGLVASALHATPTRPFVLTIPGLDSTPWSRRNDAFPTTASTQPLGFQPLIALNAPRNDLLVRSLNEYKTSRFWLEIPHGSLCSLLIVIVRKNLRRLLTILNTRIPERVRYSRRERSVPCASSLPLLVYVVLEDNTCTFAATSTL